MSPSPVSESISENRLKPGLYLVATPIGNLGDMTLRGLDILRAAHLILCEDTRVTAHLLRHFDISCPLQVYNEQTEGRDHSALIDRIQKGEIIAIVSDAGMPMLSDPGYQLVQACIKADILVTSAPGASSILTALQLSGLPSDAFLFMGFLPNKTGERQSKLREMAGVPATLILFERAQRTDELLRDVRDVLGDRRVVVARELTKLFEDVRRGSVDQVLESLDQNPIKGEVVVLIDRKQKDAAAGLDEVTDLLRAHMADKPLRVAVDDVTGLTGMPRRTVYDMALRLRDEEV